MSTAGVRPDRTTPDVLRARGSLPAGRGPAGTPPAADVVLAEPAVGDAAGLWRLARDVGLDENSAYSYLMFCRDFAATSVVARGPAGVLLGFVTGYRRPDAADTLFVWQVGVAPPARRTGLGARMLDHLRRRPALAGVRFVEATVTPGNVASDRLFRRFGADAGAAVACRLGFAASMFPDGSPSHADEILYRIGPLQRTVAAPAAGAGCCSRPPRRSDP